MFGASCALAAAPNLCVHGGQWEATGARAPAAVMDYLDADDEVSKLSRL